MLTVQTILAASADRGVSNAKHIGDQENDPRSASKLQLGVSGVQGTLSLLSGKASARFVSQTELSKMSIVELVGKLRV